MKKYLIHIGNIVAILVGLIGLKTPYVTDALIAIGLGGFSDSAFLQPLFIGFIIVAIYGQFIVARVNLSFMILLLQFVVGIVAFIFVFPVQNLILGYISLAGLLVILLWPFINKKLQKKKVVKIKV